MNINKIKQSRFGRIVCRLFGEERGAVMMEYVIVAVLIAAAVAVGAWLFGAQILRMFGIGGDAAMGRTDAAKANIRQLQNEKTAQDDAALKYSKEFPQASEEAEINVGI